MTAKTYLANLLVTIGEHESKVTLLIVANSDTQAYDVLDDTAANFYGDGTAPQEDSGYYSNGGEIHTRAGAVHEIGLATFTELQRHFMVRRAENVNKPSLDDTDTLKSLKTAAASVSRALKVRGVTASSSVVLEALSTAMGQVNWQVLNAKVKSAAQSVKQPDCLIILPSSDGPVWDLYATVSAESADQVLAQYSAWLTSKKAEDMALPEGEAYLEEDVHVKLQELGCRTFTAIKRGIAWD